MNLQSLHAEARRRLLTPEFLRGEHRGWTEAECEDDLSAIERDIPLDGFCAVVNTYTRRLDRRKADIDGELAVALHKALRLDRREASDAGVWRYLAIVVAPGLIRRRWSSEEQTFRQRFWRHGTRPDSNYYSRMWWIAELTSGADGDYGRTLKVLRAQALATAIFVRSFCHYFPAVKACVKVLDEQPSEIVARVVREFYRELALIPREALSDADAEEILLAELARARATPE